MAFLRQCLNEVRQRNEADERFGDLTLVLESNRSDAAAVNEHGEARGTMRAAQSMDSTEENCAGKER